MIWRPSSSLRRPSRSLIAWITSCVCCAALILHGSVELRSEIYCRRLDTFFFDCTHGGLRLLYNFCFWLKPRHFACALECTKTIPHGGEISSVDFPNVFIVSRIQDILSIFHSTRASWSIKRRFSRALGVVIKNNYFICEIHFCCLVSGDWKVRNPIIIGPRQSVNGFQQSKQWRRGDIVNCEEKYRQQQQLFDL